MLRRQQRVKILALVFAVGLVLVGNASASSLPIATESLSAFGETGVVVPSNQIFVLEASADSFTNRASGGNDNYGSEAELVVTRDRRRISVGGVDVRVRAGEVQVAFNLESICSGVSVQSAMLSLTGPASNDTRGLMMRANKRGWDEELIDHDTRPSTFKLLDVDYLPSLTADAEDLTDDDSRATYLAATTSNGYSELSVDVSPWITDSSGTFDPTTIGARYGWSFQNARETIWHSKEANVETLRPALTIITGPCL